ncbi:retron St85 family RNA-directed DNA polymerase [Metapseudomonas furukawaii]|uniref:retron St85 family RNA-directed DNA polymerase n=1 Tax=Metapseudomonas furukawaii TaxID=1149133 RepID=UPI00227B4D2E|nr:retron St85 family RNA-directed DNA polymerase [Pseudomonas furukawaii]WAG79106.1 retron St85 family RNA-directed DNA polymerase [Pseudomonas furukawaii]
MGLTTNSRIVRLALGCIQPADPEAVSSFLSKAFKYEAELIPEESIQEIFDQWSADGEVVCVHKKTNLYSLTRLGDSRLNREERRLRDRTRLFLLKELRSAKLHLPEAGEPEKADASSAVIVDQPLQEDERPTGAARPPRVARRAARACWPLLAKQLFVGSSSRASGPFFRFLSFPTIKACAQANGLAEIQKDGIDISEISLAIGISPQLIGLLIHKPERHYRTFEIPKANGKVRVIQSPRTMMKVVQYFLLDYLLYKIPVHISATAYSRGCTIRANAEVHVGKKYVANIDIENFFPSIKWQLVHKVLAMGGLEDKTAYLISKITSYQGGLPQGAPTSAHLSNVVLYPFDKEMFVFCESVGVGYTRYADDITFSGDDIDAVRSAVEKATQLLAFLKLEINKDKTRVFGPSSRQVVTGVVVNEWAQPSREKRRKLRAELHQAKKNPEKYASRVDEIRGMSAYMLSFAGENRPVGGLSHSYVESSLARLTSYVNAMKEQESSTVPPSVP